MVLIKILFQGVYRLSARNRCILGKLTRSVKDDQQPVMMPLGKAVNISYGWSFEFGSLEFI